MINKIIGYAFVLFLFLIQTIEELGGLIMWPFRFIKRRLNGRY